MRRVNRAVRMGGPRFMHTARLRGIAYTCLRFAKAASVSSAHAISAALT
jgi:hypothetical protein